MKIAKIFWYGLAAAVALYAIVSMHNNPDINRWVATGEVVDAKTGQVYK